MKKPLVLLFLPLCITACDLSNGLTPSKKQGVSLNLSCQDPLQIKVAGEDNYSSSFKSEPTSLGNATIKLENGKITFYEAPIANQFQLKEDNGSGANVFYYDQQFEFNASGSDFIYISDIKFESKNDDSKLFKNLRVALFEKSTMDCYYCLSPDKNGTTTVTEGELDLNADGTPEGTYTTGSPSYTTDNYDLVIPSESEISGNNIPSSKVLIPTDKALNIRMWIEGWDLSNEDLINDYNAKVNIQFTAL